MYLCIFYFSNVSNVCQEEIGIYQGKNLNMERQHKQKATESDCKAGNPDESHSVVKFVKGNCSRLQLNFSLTAKSLHPGVKCVLM